MASFTTRVELLNNPTADEYETLHEEMGKRNFTRTITSDDGIEYHLPPAEYNRIGTYTRAQTLEAAKSAATATGKTCRVVVTESAGRTWHNLQKV